MTYEIVRMDEKVVRERERRRRRRRRELRRRRARVIFRFIVLMGLTATACLFVNARGTAKGEKPEELKSDDPPKLVIVTTTPEPVEPESRYTLYDIGLPVELQNYTEDLCKEYGVSYPLVLAIMWQESRYQAGAVSATSDYGIMQINQGNHEWLEEELGVTDWLDPKQNILAGVYILSAFDYDDPHKVLMSYNCGPTGARNLWEDGIYSTAYSRAVVEALNGLEVMTND